MLGRLGDRLGDYSLDDRVVVQIAGMWLGDAELLAMDFVGPEGTERVTVEHDGKWQCMVAGPPTLAQYVAEQLPSRASIRPAAPSDAALAFEVPTLGDQGSAFGVGIHADALIGVEWATPRIYQAHAIRTVWASWPQGLVIAQAEELHIETDSISRIAWRPSSSTVVRTTALKGALEGVAAELHPTSTQRWALEEGTGAPHDEALAQALETLDLPKWPEEGWLA